MDKNKEPVDNNKTDVNDRKNKWLKGKGNCEWCGRHPATVNLDLKYGSHRECRYCWDR